jgi:hypothetical protein
MASRGVISFSKVVGEAPVDNTATLPWKTSRMKWTTKLIAVGKESKGIRRTSYARDL